MRPPAQSGGGLALSQEKMTDIFQEVDEEVRRDKAAEFWKKYQNLIFAGAALVGSTSESTTKDAGSAP